MLIYNHSVALDRIFKNVFALSSFSRMFWQVSHFNTQFDWFRILCVISIQSEAWIDTVIDMYFREFTLAWHQPPFPRFTGVKTVDVVVL